MRRRVASACSSRTGERYSLLTVRTIWLYLGFSHLTHESTQGATMLDGFNHVAILTPDLDRLEAFYRDVFDVDDVNRMEFRGPAPHAAARRPVGGAPRLRARRAGAGADLRAGPRRPPRAQRGDRRVRAPAAAARSTRRPARSPTSARCSRLHRATPTGCARAVLDATGPTLADAVPMRDGDDPPIRRRVVRHQLRSARRRPRAAHVWSARDRRATVGALGRGHRPPRP